MAPSWKDFSPTTSDRLFYRRPLQRLAELAGKSEQDPRHLYSFDQILLKVDPPAPEWLAWVLAEAVKERLVETIFSIRCPNCDVAVGDGWNDVEDIPERIVCDFCSCCFEKNRDKIELRFRFRNGSRRIPPIRRLFMTRLERIGLAATDQDVFDPEVEYAGTLLARGLTVSRPSKSARRASWERMIGTAIAAFLVVFAVVYATAVPMPPPDAWKVLLWGVLTLGFAGIGYVFDGILGKICSRFRKVCSGLLFASLPTLFPVLG